MRPKSSHTIETAITSVPEGGIKTVVLDGRVNDVSYRSVAGVLNNSVGRKKYAISVNKPTGVMYIINHG